jgi:cell fate (sporulation/competence/biofilm development) regulator YmcA (YheA/YmcA/DUF963 family)
MVDAGYEFSNIQDFWGKYQDANELIIEVAKEIDKRYA